MTTATTAANTAPTFAWRAASRLLNHLTQGSLTLNYEQHSKVFGSLAGPGPHAEVAVLDAKVFRDMMTGGSMAAAETYMEGLWDSPDLTSVIRLFSANIDSDPERVTWMSRPSQWFLNMAHWLNRNTIRGSHKNIQAHYDLGNDLFTSFLDPSMMYSAAIFPRADASLEEAQQFRLERICQKLNLGPDNHLLEIGTGWGALAIYAAKNFGCRVTTTTISAEQFTYTQAKIVEAGLTDRITLLCSDYRLLTGQYDRLVSIEMIEAVGHKYLSGYFNKISKLLSDDGLALIQSITMNDQRYQSYKNSVDFIRKYIFPGGHLPSISLINRHIAEQTNMTLSHFEDITSHYARTLNEWQVRFVENFDQLPADKYDAQFFRMWRYYLSYCEGAFLERAIGTSQIVFSKSKATVDWEY